MGAVCILQTLGQLHTREYCVFIHETEAYKISLLLL